MDVESVLEALKIERVKTKGEEIVCRCPLTSHEHDNRQPAFQVNQVTGLWLCFKGCGKGNLQSLAETLLGDAAAARKLMREADGFMSGTRVGNRGLAHALSVMREAGAPKKPTPKPVRLAAYNKNKIPAWVRQRGFTPATLRKYGLGASYAFDSLVIPVPDAHALIYRAAPGRDDVAKYKYTRDFKSHSVLYTRFGFEMVDDTIILVEGPLDALWLRQHGFSNSLSILGGGTVGVKQREVIADLDPKRIVLAFDNDEGGTRTTEKALRWLKRYDCYTVDWTRFGTKTVQDEDDNDMEVAVKDVAELDLPDLLLMFGKEGPLLIQPASLPKVGQKKTQKRVDSEDEEIVE